MAMSYQHSFLIFSFFLLAVAAASLSATASLNRQSFPDGFMFGAGSSAYQNEGAAREDGKGPSIWDIFTHKYPDKISDHSNGDVADNMYHRFKGDVKIVKEIGLDALRISISWSRILPRGKLSLGKNQAGMQYYNDLINELLANGIKPFVTLLHWDPPQALEDGYGGFLSNKIVDDYLDYVDLCFREFGDRVKHWATINEPNNYSVLGFADGTNAPGRCSKYIGNCTAGNSAIEPYQVTHNLLLAHASAFQLYRNRYKASQKGFIGMTISCNWYIPLSNRTSDLNAAARAFDFESGWILEPITHGEYPEIMRSIVGSRLPNFTAEQSKMLKQSYDYVGLNYYTTSYATDDNSSTPTIELSYTTDSHVSTSKEKDGVPIGEPTAISWLYIYPEGIRYMTKYVKEKYGNPFIIITENGVAQANNLTMPINKALQDLQRIRYHKLHLASLLKAIRDGVNVQGYFMWSIFDDFEWNFGYTYRFGLNYIDYENGLTRYLKYSAIWFKKFLQKPSISDELEYSPI